MSERAGGAFYSVEDGPGTGRRVEVTATAMVGTMRSTVLVQRGPDVPAALHEVREHGWEADGVGAAVEAALRAGLGTLGIDQVRHGDTVVEVRIAADGRVSVRSRGERMRVVAVPERLPAVVGQRVAELVGEALAARARGTA